MEETKWRLVVAIISACARMWLENSDFLPATVNRPPGRPSHLGPCVLRGAGRREYLPTRAGRDVVHLPDFLLACCCGRAGRVSGCDPDAECPGLARAGYPEFDTGTGRRFPDVSPGSARTGSYSLGYKLMRHSHLDIRGRLMLKDKSKWTFPSTN